MRTLSLLLALAVASPLAAQTQQMSSEQAQLYRAYRLDVDLVETTTYRGRSDAFETIIYPTSVDVDWIGYVGVDRVSEVDFYRHAGFDELADRIASRRARGTAYYLLGIPVALAGIVVGAAGLSSGDDGESSNDLVFAAGVGLIAVGGGMIRASGRMRDSPQTSPRQAQEAAIQFNESLERSILSGQ